MSNLTTSAPTEGRQVSFTLPADFPAPKFSFGQQVESSESNSSKFNRHIKGRIVGMSYVSRDAALAEHSLPGWSYLIETPAFKHSDPLHSFIEEELALLDEQSQEVT